MSTAAAIAPAIRFVAEASQRSPSNQSRTISREYRFAAEKCLDFQPFSAAFGPAGGCAGKNTLGGCAGKYGIATTLRGGWVFEFVALAATGRGARRK
jgi:hypothetical protein